MIMMIQGLLGVCPGEDNYDDDHGDKFDDLDDYDDKFDDHDDHGDKFDNLDDHVDKFDDHDDPGPARRLPWGG